MPHRAQSLLLAAWLLVAFTPRTLHAHDKDQIHIGQSITVAEDEDAGDLVCVGCSIRVEGSSGDVVAVGGSIMVEGTVKGDLAAIGGSISLGDSASVSGDVASIGGHVSRSPKAMVRGDVTEKSRVPLLLGIFLIPVIPLVLIVALIVWLIGRNRRPTTPRVGNQPQ